MENIMNMVILTACSHPASHKPGRFTLSTPCHPQLLNQSTGTREEKPQSRRTPDLQTDAAGRKTMASLSASAFWINKQTIMKHMSSTHPEWCSVTAELIMPTPSDSDLQHEGCCQEGAEPGAALCFQWGPLLVHNTSANKQDVIQLSMLCHPNFVQNNAWTLTHNWFNISNQ